MKVQVLAPGIVTIAFLLTLSILVMIVNLTFEHLKNRKTVTVSYPCIVAKADKWIGSADLKMDTYLVSRYDSDDCGLENVIAKR